MKRLAASSLLALCLITSGCCGAVPVRRQTPDPAILKGPRPETRGDKVVLDSRDFEALLRELRTWRAYGAQ